MGIVHELTRKPWLAEEGPVDSDTAGKSFPLPSEKLALRIFLTVVTVLFSLMVVVYSDRMVLSDWHPIQEPWLLWVNTALLIGASVAFHSTLKNARRGELDSVKFGMRAAGVCTFAFLVGQLWVAQQLGAAGYFMESNPAVAFFYLLTGAHAVHLVGGLFAWGRTAYKLGRGYELDKIMLNFELCTTYWHYMLGIWVVLFGLMVLT